MGPRKRQIDQLHTANWDVLTDRSDCDKLPEVRRAVKKNERPHYPQGMVVAFQWKVELLAMQSVGEAGCVRLRNQFVLRGLVTKLQDAGVVDRSIFQKDGEGDSDAKLCTMHAIGDNQVVRFSFHNRPRSADRVIFQGEAVSGPRRNDEASSFEASLGA